MKQIINQYLAILSLSATCLVAPNLIASEQTTQANGTAFYSLFTSDQQRTELDQQRIEYFLQKSEKTSHQPKPNEILKDIEISGIVIRSDGTQIVWVNGEMIDNKQSNHSHITFQSQTPSVKIHNANSTLELKPGQVWDKTTNKIIENYSYIPTPPPNTKTITNESIEQDHATLTQ